MTTDKPSATYLCKAWGETDLPCVCIVSSRVDVQEFLIREWFGAADDPELPDILREFDAHDWNDGPLEWEFEIGGVRISQVYVSAERAKEPSAEAVALKKLIHAAFHLLDDSEENAQTGAISIDNEISGKDLKELGEALDELGIDSHGDIDSYVSALQAVEERARKAEELLKDAEKCLAKTSIRCIELQREAKEQGRGEERNRVLRIIGEQCGAAMGKHLILAVCVESPAPIGQERNDDQR